MKKEVRKEKKKSGLLSLGIQLKALLLQRVGPLKLASNCVMQDLMEL